MKDLICKINKLKNQEVKLLIHKRLQEFKELGGKCNHKLFIELCFCLMTANYDAAKAIKIQEIIGNGFLTLTQPSLAEKLKELGYRYPNKRSEYIVEARKILKILKSNPDRPWLVENVKGLGFKEASHFLRNIGYDDYAIIDFHIVNILVENKLIEKPKSVNKKNYVEIENVLKELGKKVNLNMAELDLYLWYLETNKILK